MAVCLADYLNLPEHQSARGIFLVAKRIRITFDKLLILFVLQDFRKMYFVRKVLIL